MDRIGRWIRSRASGDQGMGLILVIGVSVLIFALAGAAAALAVNGISQSRERNGYEESLSLAETGVDRVLSEVQNAYATYSADYPVPGPASIAEPTPWCPGTAISFPTSGNGSGGVFAATATKSAEQLEREWARAKLDALIGGPCLQHDAHGEYVVLKPTAVAGNAKYGRVYALAAVPSFADPDARIRMIKAEYIFMPYRPGFAVLSNEPLDVGGSSLVKGAYGVAASLAAVHSNGNITGTGNPTAAGPVTSTNPSAWTSNNFPGGTIGAKPAQAIPTISARAFYGQAAMNDPAAIADWYDLCTDGSVRPYSTGGPCTSGTSVGTATVSTDVRGWTYAAASHTWYANPNLLDGTYYAYQANIDTDPGNGTFTRVTLVAEAKNADTCAAKQYGNITWDHYSLLTPAYHNMWMLADTDLLTTSNFSAGVPGPPVVVSGMVVAGDQMQLETSSAGLVGATLAGGNCASPPSNGLFTTSQLKNPVIWFDPKAESPFSTIITTSLWLDYQAG